MLFRPVPAAETTETNDAGKWDSSDAHGSPDSPLDTRGETKETQPTPNEFKKLSLEQVKARLESLNGAPVTPESDRMEQRLVERWAQLDPSSAATYAAQAVDAGAPVALLQAAMAVWAKSDPTAASAWAVTLTSLDLRENAVDKSTALGPPQTGDRCLQFPKLPKAHPNNCRGVLLKTMQNNLSQALEWTKLFPEPCETTPYRRF